MFIRKWQSFARSLKGGAILKNRFRNDSTIIAGALCENFTFYSDYDKRFFSRGLKVYIKVPSIFSAEQTKENMKVLCAVEYLGMPLAIKQTLKDHI